MSAYFALNRKRWLPIAVVIGVVSLIFLASIRPAPKVSAEVTLAPLVETMKVEVKTLDPVITGFGRAQPKESWSAISEVSGRVIYRHPDLERGRTLPVGTVVIKIDPVDYELAVAQSRSNLKSAELEVDRVNLNLRSYRQSVKFEQDRLALAKKELTRKGNLNQQGLISSSELEAQRNAVLAQEQAVWDLESRLALIPTDLEVATANLKVAQAKLKEAERTLTRTQIRLPFESRIGEVNVELDQVVNLQQVLVEAYDMGAMEVTANMSLSDVRQLMFATSGSVVVPGQRIPDIRNLGLAAKISLPIGDQSFHWFGTVSRINDSIDAAANTIGLTALVKNDMTKLDPRKAPPLLKDMYVQVEVSGKGQPMVVVPSKALHGDKAYVVDKQGQLQLKQVTVMFEQNGEAAIKSGLVAGEQLVLSDILSPQAGMQVRVQESEK